MDSGKRNLMMDIMNSSKESSSKGQEDGDGATGSERPLKKARFAWQVKGKYHLKNEKSESNQILTRQEPTSGPSLSSQSSSSTIAKNYLIKQDYNKLDSVVNSNNSLHTTVNTLPEEQHQYPRYISSYERTSKSLPKSCCNKMKTVSMSNNAEEQCIAQWQAKQLRKGYLDNTLNRVLETWATEPLPAEDANSRFLALDFAEFINHLPGDNSVENEGILMAISAHGLQNTPSSTNNISNVESSSVSSINAFESLSPSRCLSPVVSDDSQDTTVQQLCETEYESSSLRDWQTEQQNVDDSTSFAYFTEPSPSYNFYQENQNPSSDSFNIDGHFDFMNTAVLHAIKSKGLTASGTEYG